MLTLLHGDNTEQSRAELTRLMRASAGKELREISGREADLTALTQALSSQSLFGGETVVVIERLFAPLKKNTATAKAFAAELAANAEQIDIILWEDRELPASTVKLLDSRTAVRLFKTPVILFKFLDGLRPDHAKDTLALYKQTVKVSAPELVYALVVRRIRQLLLIKNGGTPSGMRDWQIGRLTTQAKLFTMKKLQAMHTQLVSYEYGVKSGRSPFTISDCIELFLADV